MSSHDPFAYFGLNRKTATEADVKRCYATKLKEVRPEDDREGFMALRAAFEKARDEARWRAEYPQEAEKQDEWVLLSNSEQSEVIAAEAAAEAALETTNLAPSPENEDWQQLVVTVDEDIHDQTTQKTAVDIAMQDIEALIASPFAGASMSPWLAIIERDDLQSIDEYQELSLQLRWFICQATGGPNNTDQPGTPDWLSTNVLQGLIDHFGWLKQFSRDYWVIEQTDWIARIKQELLSPTEQLTKSHSRRSRRRRRSHQAPAPQSSTYDIHEDPLPITKTSKNYSWGAIIFRVVWYGFIFWFILGKYLVKN